MRLALLLTGLLLALPGSAAAKDFGRLYRDFRDDGRLRSCAYGDATLERAERSVPPDVEQYAPSFREQLRAGRLAIASGECDGRSGAGGAALAGLRAPSIDAAAGASTPLAIWILAVVAGIAALALLGWLAGRRYGWSLERWTRPFGAATTEAGERTADLARDFWDWLRRGR